jgi:hypothetical protein
MNHNESQGFSVDAPNAENSNTKVERLSRRNVYVIAIVAFIAIAGLFLYSSQHTSYKLYVDDATVTVDGHLLSSVGLRSNSTLEANATLWNKAEYTTDQYHTPPYSVGLDDNGPDAAGNLYLYTTGMEDYHVYNATWYMKESQRGFYYVSALAVEGNVTYHL